MSTATPHPASGHLLRNAEKERGDEMLTKHELAAKLKVSVRCIENWQRAGHLPFIKIGSVVLFIWTDVVTHLKSNFQVNPGDGVRHQTGI